MLILNTNFTTKKTPLLPYNKKDLLPKRRIDLGLFFILVTAIPLILLFEIFIVKPHYNVKWTYIDYFHLLFAIFCTLNIYGNLYFLRKVDVTGRQKNLPFVLEESLKFCPKCHINSPPRAFHCRHCDECVLKRDHHCLFAGCCIGYNNQRYFFWIVFYLLIGAIYVTFYQASFVLQHIFEGFSLLSFHMFMWSPWMYGGFYQLKSTATMLQGLVFFAAIMAAFQLVDQAMGIASGATAYERRQLKKGKPKPNYNLGLAGNLKDIFGVRWYLTWLLPFIASPQKGEGLSFMNLNMEAEKTV